MVTVTEQKRWLRCIEKDYFLLEKIPLSSKIEKINTFGINLNYLDFVEPKIDESDLVDFFFRFS